MQVNARVGRLDKRKPGRRRGYGGVVVYFFVVMLLLLIVFSGIFILYHKRNVIQDFVSEANTKISNLSGFIIKDIHLFKFLYVL